MSNGDKIEGKAKEMEGKVTNDTTREVEGKGQQAKADAEQAGKKIEKDMKS